MVKLGPTSIHLSDELKIRWAKYAKKEGLSLAKAAEKILREFFRMPPLKDGKMFTGRSPAKKSPKKVKPKPKKRAKKSAPKKGNRRTQKKRVKKALAKKIKKKTKPKKKATIKKGKKNNPHPTNSGVLPGQTDIPFPGPPPAPVVPESPPPLEKPGETRAKPKKRGRRSKTEIARDRALEQARVQYQVFSELWESNLKRFKDPDEVKRAIEKVTYYLDNESEEWRIVERSKFLVEMLRLGIENVEAAIKLWKEDGEPPYLKDRELFTRVLKCRQKAKE